MIHKDQLVLSLGSEFGYSKSTQPIEPDDSACYVTVVTHNKSKIQSLSWSLEF